MSFLGSIGAGLKKVGKVALPLAGLIPGVGTGVKLASALLSHTGQPHAVGGMAGAADMATPEQGGLMGGLKKVGGFLGDHGDQLLGAASLGEGYLGQRKANNYQNEALNIGRQSYADRAGLRKLGISGMMNEQAPDLTDTFASANPYSKLRRVG